MKTAADVLNGYSRRLNEITQNTPLGEDAFHAIHSARRTLDYAAEWCEREKCPAELPRLGPVVTLEDARLKVRTLRTMAAEWRKVSAETGMAFTPLAEDYIRELEAEANALEAQIPPRPWGRYIAAALLCYALGALTAWGML